MTIKIIRNFERNSTTKCFPVLRCSFCMIFRRQIKLSAIQPPLALEMSVDQFCSSSLLINSLTNTYLWLLQRLQTLLQMQTLYQKQPLQWWFCWICACTQLNCAGVFISKHEYCYREHALCSARGEDWQFLFQCIEDGAPWPHDHLHGIAAHLLKDAASPCLKTRWWDS